jgi:hypothetical protein
VAAPISQARYIAIVKTLKASLPLDSGIEADWIVTYNASCKRLSTNDPLLRAYRTVCLDWVGTYLTSFKYNFVCPYLQGTTKSPLKGINLVDRCQGRQNLYDASLQSRLIPASRKLNAALDRYVRTKACRKAFYATPIILRTYRQFAEAYRLMGRGQVTSSSKEINAGSDQLQRISYSFPTNHQQFSEFQKGCQ